MHAFISCDTQNNMLFCVVRCEFYYDRVADTSSRLKFVTGVSSNWLSLLSVMRYSICTVGCVGQKKLHHFIFAITLANLYLFK